MEVPAEACGAARDKRIAGVKNRAFGPGMRLWETGRAWRQVSYFTALQQ